VKRAKTIL